MRIYIAGPIKNRPDGNRSAFLNAAVHLDGRGHTAVNPHEVVPDHQGPCVGGVRDFADSDHTRPCYIRADLQALLTCDAIYLLHGWEDSAGARLELDVAQASKFFVLYQGKDM